MIIQVGDKLVQKDYGEYRLFTVTKIMPSGRMKVQRDDRPTSGEILNPDLSVRGYRGQLALQIITPEIRDDMDRLQLLRRIECGFHRRNKLTLDKVQSLHQWMTDAGLLAD